LERKVLVIAGNFMRGGAEARQPLLDAGFEVVDAPPGCCSDEDSLIALLDGYDAVIAANEGYTDKVFAALPRLKVVARWGVGVDAVDLAAATRHGRFVLNTPGVLADAVADLAWMFILALARRWREAEQRVLSGGWGEIFGVSLSGKTLGIIGLGAIGQCVARRGNGFGMACIGYDPQPNEAALAALSVRLTSLEEVLGEADFLSLHAKTTPESVGMIGAAQLQMMKPTAYLINTARGALVDQAALARALQEGWIAGAGLDVLAQEPPPADEPLLRLPNCLVTPHCGSANNETARAVNALVCRNIVEALSGVRPRFLVNSDLPCT
jgi:phosphoglycerate dehydrogenase-like enzyme